MTFGEKLKEARKKKGISQQVLADRLNVSQQMIAQYENDKRQPKSETKQKIADALGIDVYDLIEGGFGALNPVLPPNMQNANLDGARIDIFFLNTMMSRLANLDKSDPRYERTKDNLMALAASSGLEEYAEFVMQEIDNIAFVRVSHEEKEALQKNLDLLIIDLISSYNLLNLEGKKEAVKRVDELTQIPRYKKRSTESGSPDPDSPITLQDNQYGISLDGEI